MSQPPRSWTSSLDELQREMERYVEHMSRRKPHTVVFSRVTWEPAVDLYEAAEHVVALIDLSGVAENAINLVVQRDTLTVSGERRELSERGERRYCYLEIPFGPFERTLYLPAPVDPDGTTATYRAGFLEVVMRKLDSAARRIVLRNE